jgi:hypothetical protein
VLEVEDIRLCACSLKTNYFFPLTNKKTQFTKPSLTYFYRVITHVVLHIFLEVKDICLRGCSLKQSNFFLNRLTNKFKALHIFLEVEQIFFMGVPHNKVVSNRIFMERLK